MLFFNSASAAAMFGEPKWGYFKQFSRRHSKGRNSREFHHVSGEWIEVSKEEYDKEYPHSRKTDMDRFMGQVRVGDFWRYRLRMIEGGWITVMEKRLKEIEEHGSDGKAVESKFEDKTP